MEPSAPQTSHGNAARSTPRLLMGLGVLPLTATLVLAARLVWEETFLTWSSGPQMVGFSLAHGSAAALLLAPFVLSLWIVAAFIVLAILFLKKRRPSPAVWLTLGGALVILGIPAIPTNFWQWCFATQFARSPHAGELLNEAAAQGQSRTVRQLILHGANAMSLDQSGDTPLHSAAKAGNLAILQFLITEKVDLDALNLYGDSPVEIAFAHEHPEAANFLQSRGAIRITGTTEQRRSAIHLIVTRDLERMNHSGKK